MAKGYRWQGVGGCVRAVGGEGGRGGRRVEGTRECGVRCEAAGAERGVCGELCGGALPLNREYIRRLLLPYVLSEVDPERRRAAGHLCRAVHGAERPIADGHQDSERGSVPGED